MLKILQEHADIVWLDFCQIYPALKFSPVPKIILSNRLTKTGGYMNWDKTEIVLARKLLVFRQNSKIYFDVIIPHELAHYVDYILNGIIYADDPPSTHHRPSWQAIMRKYGLPPDMYHSLEIP
jgi:predicted SprT family Zn-dependent metalloprotease